MAGPAGTAGDTIGGARRAGTAGTTWGELGIFLAPHDRARFERYQEEARAALGADAFEQAQGRSMTWKPDVCPGRNRVMKVFERPSAK